MSIIFYSLFLFLFSLIAGMIGALTGLGGGVIIVPVLILIFHVNIHEAMGASLVSVVATASGASLINIKRNFINLRIGLFLEMTAVISAIIGAMLVVVIPKNILSILFSFVLLFSAYLNLRPKLKSPIDHNSHPWADILTLNGNYLSKGTSKNYKVQNVPLSLVIMTFAGLLSGLLGIGAGVLKVLAMDQALRLPYKVSTATSNFMMGLTAAAGAGIYFANGYIDAVLSFPVLLGVLIGSSIGAHYLGQMKNDLLRAIFSVVICLIAIEMLFKALGH